MKKILSILFIFILCFSGCGNASFTKSCTYNVETGDIVKVSLDATGGYDIDSTLPFSISKDEEVITQGTFVTSEAYDLYLEAIQSDEKALLIESIDEDGYNYLFWEYNDTEWNYLIMLGGFDTGVLLSNTVSMESARECFDRLEFTLE